MSNDKITVYKSYNLKDRGLNEIILKKVKVNSKKYNYENKYIEMVVNPLKIIGAENKVTITKVNQISDFINNLDEILKEILPGVNSCIFWQVKRIDYAIDKKVEQNLINYYLKLFNRADIGNLQVPYNYKSKRRKQMQGSYRLSNNSITINFYNKLEERINKNVLEDIEDAENVLRLEVQCKKTKVNNIKNKNKWEYNILLHYLDPRISTETLYKYYKKTIGEGDYYTLNKAIELINNSNYRKGKKDKLIEVITLINKKRSVTDAKAEYKNKQNSFKYYLKEIKKLNVNVVTIPERWGIDYLKNVWHVEDY